MKHLVPLSQVIHVRISSRIGDSVKEIRRRGSRIVSRKIKFRISRRIFVYPSKFMRNTIYLSCCKAAFPLLNSYRILQGLPEWAFSQLKRILFAESLDLDFRTVNIIEGRHNHFCLERELPYPE